MKDSKILLKNIYKKRPEWSHKGDFGKVLVIGGSKKYTGAPRLVALAAFASGADLVAVAAPRRAADIAAISPEIITYPLEGDYLSEKDFKYIEKLLGKFDSVVFGNGLGEKSKKLCQSMWKIKKPCVVDGDALKFVDRKLGPNFLLTPHAGEFAILSGEMVSINLEERKKLVKEYAEKFGCTILLKGHIDIISDGKQVLENRTGSPYMTKAGTGDVLAGICGALLARKIFRGVWAYNISPSILAAEVGAYISGKAGELASKEKGESLLAKDVIGKIKEVVNVNLH